MANVSVDLPQEFQNPHSKYRVLEYLRELQLPARHKRKILMDWGDAQGVDILHSDYVLISTPASLREGA